MRNEFGIPSECSGSWMVLPFDVDVCECERGCECEREVNEKIRENFGFLLGERKRQVFLVHEISQLFSVISTKWNSIYQHIH